MTEQPNTPAAGSNNRSTAIGCAAVVLVLAVLLVAGWLYERLSRSEAENVCRDAVEERLGFDAEDVDFDNIEETSSGVLTKVEGDVTYRDVDDAERHDTWFICQLEGDEDDYEVREVTIK